jgi:hypothetical protein
LLLDAEEHASVSKWELKPPFYAGVVGATADSSEKQERFGGRQKTEHCIYATAATAAKTDSVQDWPSDVTETEVESFGNGSGSSLLNIPGSETAPSARGSMTRGSKIIVIVSVFFIIVIA